MSHWDEEFIQHQLAMAEEPSDRRVFTRSTYVRRAVKVAVPKISNKLVEKIVSNVMSVHRIPRR